MKKQNKLFSQRIIPNFAGKYFFFLLAAAVFFSIGSFGQYAAPARAEPNTSESEADKLIRTIGASKGLCVFLGLPDGEKERTIIKLANKSELLIYAQSPDAREVETIRKAAKSAGLLCTRVYADQGSLTRVHLADNLADTVFVSSSAQKAGGVTEKEVLRVLRPEGKGVFSDREIIKPFPEGTDDWPHHYHGPDNNPLSKDLLARPPYLTQFIAEPRYGPAPQSAVASRGRVFIAFGHVAWHERSEPLLNTLLAVNGFNGAVLWQRPLKPGIMVDRSMMIATPEILYLCDDESCKLIDPASGRVKGEIIVPAGLAGGTFWKWMALENGILYALIGGEDVLDPVAQWRTTRHGWRWHEISDGYNMQEHPWGFAETLVAVDPNTKKIIWHHKEKSPIDSRALCMKNGRIFFCSFGKYLACLDSGTGRELWRKTPENDSALFKAIGPWRTRYGAFNGWRTTIYLTCSGKAVYFSGPQVFDLTAVSAEDGTHLWTHSSGTNNHIVLRDDGLYAMGAQRSNEDTHKLDPLTGTTLKSYGIMRRACTRSTGSADSIFFRSTGDGTERLDPVTGEVQWISPMRPGCFTGVLVANGHLYWTPWECDCNLQMCGLIACGTAGDFQIGKKAAESGRLETAGGNIKQVKKLRKANNQWPAYRCTNTLSATIKRSVPEGADLLWHFKPEFEFEASAPVAAGGMVFLGGSDGIVRALDENTGLMLWSAYTGGPVNYPPAIANDRAIAGSGDGWVYAFEAATGRLLWRFRAAPEERKIPVFGKLLSTWPVASNVQVYKGTAYVAAGINNYDGTHIYALNAADGNIKWQNNSSGHLPVPEGGGVSVQGEMLLSEGKLYLAGGNAVSPAVYDMETGEYLSVNAEDRVGSFNGRRGRELRLFSGKNFRGEPADYVTVSGQPLYSSPDSPVFDSSAHWDEWHISAENANLTCLCEKNGSPHAASGRDSLWQLVAGNPVSGADFWRKTLPGKPVRWGIAVSGDRVIVTLTNGQVLCYGATRDASEKAAQ